MQHSLAVWSRQSNASAIQSARNLAGKFATISASLARALLSGQSLGTPAFQAAQCPMAADGTLRNSCDHLT